MGYIAQNHIAAWNGIKDAQICAVICLEQDIGLAAAEAIGNHCTYYATNEDALANEEIHIVDICVPTFLHEFFAVKAASAGCHVLCEKPVTLTLESFDKMYSACQNNGVKFMVAQVERWSPEFMQIKKHLANDLLPHDCQ